MKVKGKASSVEITLLPAPRGIGLVSGEVSKKILNLAGIKDIWSKSRGQTQSTINSAKATFEALKQTTMFKTLKDEEPTEELEIGVKEEPAKVEEKPVEEKPVKEKPEKEAREEAKEKEKKESKKGKKEPKEEKKETEKTEDKAKKEKSEKKGK
jgi:Mg-chelatase subunit ChlI